MGGHRSLHQGFALAAGPFAPDMPFDAKRAGLVIQFFADVLADPEHLAAAATDRTVGLVADDGAGQLLG